MLLIVAYVLTKILFLLDLCNQVKGKLKMHTIHINNRSIRDVIIELEATLGGNLKEACGEYTLTFDNEYGKGIIRGIDFDWGLSFVDFNVNFSEVTSIIFENNKGKLVEFVYVSEGNLECEEELYAPMQFDRYQNIVLSNNKSSKKAFIFPKATQSKVSNIQVETETYKKKKNNNLSDLDALLRSIFENEDQSSSYHHLGNYNLLIADLIQQMEAIDSTGIIRTLSIEGQINLIMAMQMLAHQNSQTDKTMSDSLSSEHIKRIRELSKYIKENVSEHLSVELLSKRSGLSAKKLQLGFKFLYAKSVNEYIRDLKLEIARDQLNDLDYTISEIVYNIGYKSRSYFSKIFYERYDILPKCYRDALRKTR